MQLTVIRGMRHKVDQVSQKFYVLICLIDPYRNGLYRAEPLHQSGREFAHMTLHMAWFAQSSYKGMGKTQCDIGIVFSLREG